jgi:hypothetical protein
MQVKHTLSRIPECARPRQGRTIVPGHPIRPCLLQLLRAPLEVVQVVERIGAIQLAGVNQTHEQIADPSSIASLVKQRVLAMQDGLLQFALTDIMPIPGLCRVAGTWPDPHCLRMMADAA